MTTISVFRSEELDGIWQTLNYLKDKKTENDWIITRPSKYARHEIFVQYFYYEDLDESLKKILSEEDSEEIVSFLKRNGKTRVLKRIYCFINLLTKTLEIYRGPDSKTEEIVTLFEKLLKVKFVPLNVKSEDLQKIYSQHSIELKQVMFKNIHGLIYDILRGKFLENNEKFKQYLQQFPECLRVISFRPKIKFLNGNQKYQVTLNGDKGTIKLSDNGIFQFRPRMEIRQIVFLIIATLGLLR